MSLLFETIRVANGKMENLSFHEMRIAWSLDRNRAKEIVEFLQNIELPKEGVHKLKVIYDNESLKYEISPYSMRKISSLKIVESDISYTKKYLDRESIDALFTKRESSDEVLIVKNGELQDTSIHNIALLIDEVWWTPQNPLLKGTTRERLLQSGEIKEKRLFVEDLKEAQNIALMNAMVGFMEIGKVEIEDAND